MNSADQPVALVTGGAARVGAAIVRELSARGYRVAIHANRSIVCAEQLAGELRAAGAEAASFGAELRDEAATRAMIDLVHRHFGRLDALVNNAAIWSPTPLESVTADDLRRFLEINAVSSFVCCQHAGRLMAEHARGGAIVNIGDWAMARPYHDHAAYFLSKAVIPTMTRLFAVELAPRVRVNAVLPGPVMLPDTISPEARQRVIAGTLLQRTGQPRHVALAVAFLLENDFVTGTCLPVDGGRTLGHTG